MQPEEGMLSSSPSNAEAMFALGMMQSSGRDAPVDLIAAHKWFNIAAARGHKDAAQLRREIAAQMSDSEIGQAQRAARDWLKTNPLPPIAPVVEIRAAA
jgi:TPR repeat protein